MNTQGNTQCPYWTEDFRQAVNTCRSFDEMGEIAIRVLQSMPQPISQVCGPISTGGLGSRERNTAVFVRCINELRKRQLNPFDQFPLQDAMTRLGEEWHRLHPQESYCMPLLDEVYQAIFASGLLKRTYFLPGWETSFGSRWERETLTRLGIEIHEFPREWYDVVVAELDFSSATV
jgi:hypothetical protein